jgi:muramoyltetrapeptide carboxypeptidase LdcA involved in peptidoglycan recycling
MIRVLNSKPFTFKDDSENCRILIKISEEGEIPVFQKLKICHGLENAMP